MKQAILVAATLASLLVSCAAPRSADIKQNWHPKASFDGRIAPVCVVNPGDDAVAVALWHPDSKGLFVTFQAGPAETSPAMLGGKAFSCGSDWGIQIGGTNAPVIDLRSAAAWEASGGKALWKVDLKKYESAAGRAR